MNFRLFVEKKSDFRVEEQNLFNELKESIGIKDLENVRVFEKDEENATIVKQLNEEEYESWSSNYTLGNLWTSGHIGGNRW